MSEDLSQFHLDYEQHLEPYVDGKADDIDREIVESHVAECARCAEELRDLRAFRWQPVAGDARVTSSRRKLWAWLPKPAFAMAIVVAGFVLAVTALWWTRYSASRQTERAQANSPGPDKQGRVVNNMQPSPGVTGPAAAREKPLLVLNDAGGQVTLDQRGRLEGLHELPPDLKESVERALNTHRLRASPALTGWPTGAGDLRGELNMQSTFAPLEPTDVVVETDRPTFRWRALEGAHAYIVTVFDDKLRKVAGSEPVNGTKWTTPNSLARGVVYSWQVSALKAGETVVSPKPPLPEARFKILDQAAVAALAKLKQSAGSSHLVMGVFYWKHGLIEEAEREFKALANANPNSPAAAELLASIRSLGR